MAGKQGSQIPIIVPLEKMDSSIGRLGRFPYTSTFVSLSNKGYVNKISYQLSKPLTLIGFICYVRMTCNPDDDTDCDRNDPSSSGHDNLGQKFCGRRETLVGDINTGDEGEETMSLYMCVYVYSGQL